MDPGYAEQYQELNRRHWWWRSRERLVAQVLARRRPAQGWRAALDIGCGGGVLFPLLRTVADQVEGIEPDASLAAAGRGMEGVIHVRPFDRAFRPSAAPDLIVMLDVLEHLADARDALAHVHDIAAPGAMVLITVPAFRWLWTGHDDLNHHVTRFHRRELISLLEAAGLSVREARYFFHWLIVPKLLTRMVETLSHPRRETPRVPPRPINRLLEGVSLLEQRVFTPLGVLGGSSLLAVAVRRAA